MTHPMLEKVARAMWDDVERRAVDNDPHRKGTVDWSSAPEDFVDKYRGMARAAVQALLEPDEGMVEIGMDYDEREIEIATGTPPTPAQCVEGQFRAMLKPLLEI